MKKRICNKCSAFSNNKCILGRDSKYCKKFLSDDEIEKILEDITEKHIKEINEYLLKSLEYNLWDIKNDKENM
jgi:hypothetical protein